MDRRILLISNPGEVGEEHYCEGVKIDVQKYNDFFISALGGAWKPSEITHLEKPQKREVKNEISKLSNTDYSMIIFCGHGYVSSTTNTTQLNINPHERIDEIDLREGATRRSIILDCCRTVLKETLFEAVAMTRKYESFKGTSLERSRHYFDHEISKTPKGIIIAHACTTGETAGDSSIYGGMYSENLRLAAKNWGSHTAVSTRENYLSYSLVRAHTDATPEIKKRSGGTQNPQIEKPRSEPYFPFAILV